MHMQEKKTSERFAALEAEILAKIKGKKGLSSTKKKKDKEKDKKGREPTSPSPDFAADTFDNEDRSRSKSRHDQKIAQFNSMDQEEEDIKKKIKKSKTKKIKEEVI